MGGLTERRRAILMEQPHLATAAGDFTTDMVAPAAVSGAGSAYLRMCGKNLFDPAASLVNPSDTTSSNATKRLFTPFSYCLGTSWSNYYNPSAVDSFGTGDGTIYVVSRLGYGVGFAFPLTLGQTYILSAASVQHGVVNIGYYAADGTFTRHANSEVNILGTAFTVPAGMVMTVFTFLEPSSYYGAYTATFSGVQLEKASSGTTYEPYSGQTAYGPTSMTTRSGRNSILTTASGVSIKYWTH